MPTNPRLPDPSVGPRQTDDEPSALQNAERLFLDWLDAHEGRKSPGFDALVAANPADAAALRALHAGLFGAGGASSLAPLDRNDPCREGSDRKRLPHLEGGRPRYVPLGEVARGGMGVVLRVHDSSLDRDLAMKVMLADEASKGDDARSAANAPPKDGDRGTRRRFMEEARITARLEHPGIVPVHELGFDAEDRVYFTMRLVRGDDFVEVLRRVRSGREGWTQVRALAVLQRACEAVAYAHSKGVIHRDLKPSNIMVGRFGETYVMDWGLARVTNAPTGDPPDAYEDPTLTSRSSVLTREGDVLGTPAYMAPEQARGEVDTVGPATDIYGMGAILYEVLGGTMPYGDTPRGAMSVVLSLARRGAPTPIRALAPAAPPALVAICDKAMARAPEDRYPDMLALAHDLRAFLEDRVVTAYRTGPIVELTTWVRRNRWLAAALAAAGAIALSAAVFVTVRERQSSQAIARERDDARAMADFQASILQVDPWELGAKRAPLDLLRRAAARIDAAFAGRPELEAEARRDIARSLLAFGAADEAERNARDAVRLFSAVEGPDGVRALGARSTLVGVLRGLGRVAEAEEITRDMIERNQAVLGPDHPTTLHETGNLIALLDDQSRFDEALELGRDLLPRARRVFARDPEGLSTILGWHATTLRRSGDPRQAAVLRREILDLCAAWDVDRESLSSARINLAQALIDVGEAAEAERIVRSDLEQIEPIVGPDHPDVLANNGVLARALEFQKRFEDALEVYRELVTASQSVLGAGHPKTWSAINGVAATLLKMRRAEEALAFLDEMLADGPWESPDAAPGMAPAVERQAMALRLLSRADEAIEVAKLAVALRHRFVGREHVYTYSTEMSLGRLLREGGRLDEAEAHLRDLTERMEAHDATDWIAYPDALEQLASTLNAMNRAEEAVVAQRAACDARERISGPTASDTLEASHVLGAYLEAAGRIDESIEVGAWVVGEVRRAEGYRSTLSLEVAGDVSKRMGMHGRYEEAERLLLDHLPHVADVEDLRAKVRGWLARLYEAWGRPEDAPSLEKRTSP